VGVQIVVQRPVEAHYWVARQHVLRKPTEEPQPPGRRQQPYREVQPEILPRRQATQQPP
jgi:hypothetical protein